MRLSQPVVACHQSLSREEAARRMGEVLATQSREAFVKDPEKWIAESDEERIRAGAHFDALVGQLPDCAEAAVKHVRDDEKRTLPISTWRRSLAQRWAAIFPSLAL